MSVFFSFFFFLSGSLYKFTVIVSIAGKLLQDVENYIKIVQQTR